MAASDQQQDREDTASAQPGPQGSALEVFLAFLKLGLSAFGGPIAHLGYFREEFVGRRRWLDDQRYADLVALCQFLPGPASSQLGFVLGLRRAGWWGALSAWAGFTLPSALLLMALALGVTRWPALAASGAVQGLKIAAVAIVAQAVWGMAKTLCPERRSAGIAIAAAVLVLIWPSTLGQLGAIVAGGAAGRWALQPPPWPAAAPHDPGLSPATGALLLLLFGLLLLLLPALAALLQQPALRVVAAFYQAGALVFGGGHVVLPLLHASVVPAGWVSNESFLAGYGAAQAMPGPLFAFAAYLGTVMGGTLSGLGLLVAIFAPGLLLVAGALPFWERLRQRHDARRAMAGVNAAVVGVLGAALYDPVWTSASHTRADVALALAAFGLLVFGRRSPLLVVALAALAGMLLAA